MTNKDNISPRRLKRKDYGQIQMFINPDEIMKQQQKMTSQHERIIYLVGEVNECTAREVVVSLIEMQKDDSLKEITMILDSYGGEIDSMFAIVDMMEIIMPPVRTICLGKAMSAAAIIFLYGQKGRRFMTRHSRLMLHQISSLSNGTVSDIVIDTEEIRFLQEQVIQEISKRCKLKEKDIRNIIDRNAYIRPEKAIEYGMCDGIIERIG
jgi:ATP-dependent Clp protease protease subunit